MTPVDESFHLIAIDSVGGLNYYNSTKKYLTLLIDHHTRYIWTFASKSVTTETTETLQNQSLQKPHRPETNSKVESKNSHKEAVGSLVVRASDSRPEGLGHQMPTDSLAEMAEIEVVSPSVVPSGSFSELKSHCHLYGAQSQRQAYLLTMPR
ncbi:retrotransposable element Tf2 protein type 1 [Trichonephila clavipes]|nr:retrotransposable element Tf2 protein type 1 [Trichonephila clavipes]